MVWPGGSIRLVGQERILSGVSCGAAIAVALRLARLHEFEGKTIVTVRPDSGEHYLSGPLFEGVFDEAGLPRI
jgi:cysteine synthase A